VVRAHAGEPVKGDIMSDGGKGSSPRPFSVTQKEFDTRWDNIFKPDPSVLDDAVAEDEAFKYAQSVEEQRRKMQEQSNNNLSK